MNNSKNWVRVFIWSLSCAAGLALLGGCASMHGSGYLLDSSNGPDCNRGQRKETYEVIVNYLPDAEGDNCPHHVTFLKGDNGCTQAPKGELPPVCLCIGKKEKLKWVADQQVPPNGEFVVHFSPFQNGTFESEGGEIKPQKVVEIKKAPQRDFRIVYEYSITAGAECAVIDPPIIIRQ